MVFIQYDKNSDSFHRCFKNIAFIERNKEGTLDVIYTGTQSFVNTLSQWSAKNFGYFY